MLTHRHSCLELLYHTDSVESTSKSMNMNKQEFKNYTILTLWSQLQNSVCSMRQPSSVYHTDSVESTSKFFFRWVFVHVLYHTDSVESTSKLSSSVQTRREGYTILTLWSQLQNTALIIKAFFHLYHTDSVESTSK